MKNKEFHGQVIDKVIEKLNEQNIDVYAIITSEGSDDITTKFIPGVGTVGTGAFLFTKEGKCYSVSTSIDAQDIVETGFFAESLYYTEFSETIHDLWARLAPKRAAFNFSETEPFCDGLTVGRFQRFMDAVADLPEFEVVSAECFIPAVREEVPNA